MTSSNSNEPLNLELEPPTLSTKRDAKYLNRQPQTLRKWACLEVGPIRPHRIKRRLAKGN